MSWEGDIIFKNESIKKDNNSIIFTLVLILFIVVFFIIGSIFAFSNTKARLFTLDNSLFENNSANDDTLRLKVESVQTFDTTYPVWNPNLTNSNSLVFTTRDQGNEGAVTKIAGINMSDNTTFDIDHKIAYGELIVSSNEKKLLFSVRDEENRTSVHLYDLQNQQIEKAFDGLALHFFSDNKRFLGLIDEHLFIQEIDIGERNMISNQLTQSTYISEENGIKISMFDLKVSPDESKGFIMMSSVDTLAIKMVDLNVGSVSKVLESESITDFTPINNKNLLLQGNIDGKDGLFLYNLDEKNYKMIVKGKVTKFDITHKGILAYILQNNGGSELHIAYYDGQEIKESNKVYMDSTYVSFLKWNKTGNMLFYVSNKVGGSEIIRFTFK